MNDTDAARKMDERAIRLRKTLFRCALLTGGVLGVVLSFAINIYNYDWTPDIPDTVDRDAVGAALLNGMFGVACALGSLAYSTKSRVPFLLGVALVLIGAIRIVWLLRIP